ncbi:MAG: DNA repair protein RecO [Candidatus Poribacteria bacterium]|jgi:DNA repair protein RecO (recombination protein O)|nr:DNA repair protein RecO [Candidatus Poribacteria bacterium]
MPRPRNYHTEAIIIKKTKLGEADHILTLYTPNLGKIQAVAKGVRRPKSKMAGHLELLTHSQLSLARGRNLDTITGSQTINSFLPLKSDLNLISSALYATELVSQFTAEHVENQPLFQLLLETLHQLSQGSNSDLILRYFEIQLLNNVGYRPQLQQCISCQLSLSPVTNFFSSSAGGVLCPDCQQSQPPVFTISVNTLKVLRFFQNNDYDKANRLKINRQLSAELETIMRNYLTYVLEREIKSATWLASLKKQTPSTIPTNRPASRQTLG